MEATTVVVQISKELSSHDVITGLLEVLVPCFLDAVVEEFDDCMCGSFERGLVAQFCTGACFQASSNNGCGSIIDGWY